MVTLKKLAVSLATAVILAAPLATTPSLTANAVSGDGKTDGSKGSSAQPYGWRLITSTPGGRTAWDKLLGVGKPGYAGFTAGYTRGKVDNISKSSVSKMTAEEREIFKLFKMGEPKTLGDTCRSATNILIFQDTKNAGAGRENSWLHGWTGKTIPAKSGIVQLMDAAPFEKGLTPMRRSSNRTLEPWESSDAFLKSIQKKVTDGLLTTSHPTIICDHGITATATKLKKTPDPTPKETPRPTKTIVNPDPGGTTPPGTGTPPPPAEPLPPPPPPRVTNDPLIREGGYYEYRDGDWNEAYSWLPTVSLQYDEAGPKNLHDQGGTPVVTNYGKLVEEVRNGALYRTDVLGAKVAAALAADANLPHGQVTLDAANKTGMAEGGVLNVNEFTKYQHLAGSDRRKMEWQTRCSTTTPSVWSGASGTYVDDASATVTVCEEPELVAVSDWEPVGNYIENEQSVQTAFWQMLSTRCNAEEFQALLGSTEGEVVENAGDPENRLAAVVYSKTYKAQISKDEESVEELVPAQPDRLDFGDVTNTKAASARSAHPGFYTKECPFSCTADPKGAGATYANGARTNVRNTELPGGTVDKYGAKADAQNNNLFHFFRDNKERTLTTDVWYPKTEGLVTYDGAEPLSTTVTRWSEGTPGLTPTSESGGQFSMRSSTGEVLFDATNANKSAPEQKNWDPATFKTATSTALPGLHRAFDLKASWASEKDRPQVFNVKWEYAPEVATSFSTTVGFNAQREATRAAKEVVAVALQGKCYASYGQATTGTYKDLVAKNTGVGTTNGLDGSLLKDLAGDAATDLTVNFVRSTTE